MSDGLRIGMDYLRSRLAAVERERDQLRAEKTAELDADAIIAAALRDVSAATARANRAESERDAAVADNARLLARIAAVEALCRDTEIEIPCPDDDCGDWFGAVRCVDIWEALAASPTPTGPEPAKCEDCGWPWPLPGQPPTGAECDSCGGDLVGPATPEPTEETP